jgi:predicted RecB family nuclease
MLNGPVQLLGGVGAKAARELSEVDVHTIAELVGSDRLLRNTSHFERLRGTVIKDCLEGQSFLFQRTAYPL